MTVATKTTGKTIDWLLIFLYVGLVSIGAMMLYASTYDPNEGVELFSLNTPIGSQLFWIVISLVGLWVCMYIDWKLWNTLSFAVYGIALFMLVLVLIFGVEIKGARSWFRMGGFSFQPSELAKLATCLAMASYLSHYKTDLRRLSGQIMAIGIILLPAGLILLQPDAGSALIYFSFLILLYREGMSSSYFMIILALAFVFIITLMFNPHICVLILLYVSGIIYAQNWKNWWIYLIALSIILLGTILLWSTVSHTIIVLVHFALFILASILVWIKRRQAIASIIFISVSVLSIVSFGTNYLFNNVLKPHQRDRINVWLNPSECDPQGSLYNINQSKTAIGSGGLAGKGFLKGIMTEGNHVPEQTTDFIFSTIGEEQGFIGVLSVIILYFLLLYRIIVIGERARHLYIRRYAYGLAGILFFHFFINIGMTMGLAPVIGIPLPFISKGGTALFFFTIMIGILAKMDLSRS